VFRGKVLDGNLDREVLLSPSNFAVVHLLHSFGKVLSFYWDYTKLHPFGN